MAETDHIILRWAEIFLKGANRPAFEQLLVDQAMRLVAPIEGAKLHRGHHRVYVEVPRERSAEAVARLGKLMGLASLSPGRLVARDVEAFAAAAIDLLRLELAPGAAAAALPSFKVETNRVDKSFPLRSMEVSREVGRRVQEALGLPVDVHRPAYTVGVEIGQKRTLVFATSVPGPGGLPIGASGKVNLLLSGGIDSPVAGWLAMKRGCQIGATYFHAFPYTGDKTKEKVIDLARMLAAWQGPLVLHVVHFTEVQKQLRESGAPELAVVLYRRMMMRAAGRIARREGALALVTGENIGQVASQTIENMAAIEAASPLPVLRPLLTYDKLETVALAERIGTYALSIQPYDDCCSLFLPPHPATKARLIDAERAESALDVDALADSLAATAERIEL